MVIFCKKIILNRVTGPVSVPKFHYPDPDLASIGFKNLKLVPDPIRPISDLDLPGPNRIYVQNRAPDFFA